MKTPAGKDCPQYYADFHRERRIQECRLAKRNPQSAPWQPPDCARCAVPDIVRANASPHMRLKLEIRGGFLGFFRSNVVTAFCEKHQLVIADPIVGCTQCNAEKPALAAFLDALENSDPRDPS